MNKRYVHQIILIMVASSIMKCVRGFHAQCSWALGIAVSHPVTASFLYSDLITNQFVLVVFILPSLPGIYFIAHA